MNIKPFLLPLMLISLGLPLIADMIPYKQYEKVFVYTNGSKYSKNVKNALDKMHVSYEEINSISSDEGLYIIFDALTVNINDLPKHYIIYQTYNLDNTRLAYQIKQLQHDYTKKLRGALAIWDYSWKNIDTYRHVAPHFYHLPANYEHADPVVIPCFLPKKAYEDYKEMLIYSNSVDTEISSLIPMLFYHSYTRNPKILVESGVCFGYSTQAFIKTAELCDTEIIGLDFSQGAKASYDCVKKGTFLCIDDRTFGAYHRSSKLKDQPVDIFFIDTSHEYQHTLDELNTFMPLLADDGIIMFHDANVTPLRVQGRQAWWRINNTTQLMGPLSPPNPRGVAPAIRKFFNIPFEESKYTNTEFSFNDARWHMIHYPFCNGLTVLKRLG